MKIIRLFLLLNSHFIFICTARKNKSNDTTINLLHCQYQKKKIKSTLMRSVKTGRSTKKRSKENKVCSISVVLHTCCCRCCWMIINANTHSDCFFLFDLHVYVVFLQERGVGFPFCKEKCVGKTFHLTDLKACFKCPEVKCKIKYA